MLPPVDVFNMNGKSLVDSLIYVHCKTASSKSLALANPFLTVYLTVVFDVSIYIHLYCCMYCIALYCLRNRPGYLITQLEFWCISPVWQIIL